MSPSLYGFVKGREPVTPEEVATDFLALDAGPDGVRARVKGLVADDPRFAWDEEGALRTVEPAFLSLEDAPYVVFDVETTGSSAEKGGAITELGALKVVRGQVVDEISTLVDPKRKIEPFVVRLTGITDRMVAGSPEAAEVMASFEEFVEGCVLVGHNVRFDCSFVAAAREAAGLPPLPNPALDTLKLARALVPGLKRYRLASLVAHFGVRAAPNHRALADAAATAEVFLKLSKLLGSAGIQTVGEAATLRSRGGRVRPQKGHLAEGLPRTPGVYYFVDKQGAVLYVGKAKDLKSRVKSYFNGGDGRRKVGRLVREVAEVRHKETESELHALIFEAREIKRLLPRYNSAGRGEKASWFIKLDTTEPFPVPERVPANEAENGANYYLLGPYRSASVLDVCIEALGRVFPLRRCSGEGTGVCFYGQMGRCAPCGGMSEEEYRNEVVRGVVALLRGEGGEEHLEALVGERKRLADGLEFEAAARLRDLIAGIQRIRLARAVVSAEGVQAVAVPSTEPGLVEVFAFSSGRLVAHEGFEPGDETGLASFTERVLAEDVPPDGKGADEARVVAAYLKRRQVEIEALRPRGPRDLAEAVRRVAERAGATGEDGAENGVEKVRP